MHTDVTTGQIHAELQDGVAALEQVITELQELSVRLREQTQWPSPWQKPEAVPWRLLGSISKDSP